MTCPSCHNISDVPWGQRYGKSGQNRILLEHLLWKEQLISNVENGSNSNQNGGTNNANTSDDGTLLKVFLPIY
jgi:hypothetical protein